MAGEPARAAPATEQAMGLAAAQGTTPGPSAATISEGDHSVFLSFPP